MRTQIQRLWLLWRGAAVYHVSKTRRLVNNLYYLKPTAGFHTSVHWAFWDTQAVKPPPVRCRPLYLPPWLLNPTPCYLSQLILRTSAEGPQPAARHGQSSGSRVQPDEAGGAAFWCSAANCSSQTLRLEDRGLARSAQILLAAEEHAAWSSQAGPFERMSVPKSWVWLICVIV